MTAVSFFTLFGIILAYPIMFANGYSHGVPQKVCDTLIPGHRHTEGQTSPSPYVVNVDKTSIGQGDTVEVVVKSIHDQNVFKGFLAVARSTDLNDTIPWGMFSSEDPELARVQDCLGYFNSSATHVSNDSKTEATLQWTSPARDGHYKILTTVVKDKSTYWVAVPSEVITVGSGIPPTTTTPIPGSRQYETYKGCRESKGCFGIPSGCVEGKNCEMLVSYAVGGDENNVEFEVIGRAGFSRPYVAFGLSDDGNMGADSVFGCSVDNYKVVVSEYYNEGQENSFILTRKNPIISKGSGSYQDGFITCAFTVNRAYSVDRDGSSRSFDLRNTEYYLLVSRGTASDEGLGQHPSHSDHGVSARRTSLSDTSILGERSSILFRLHGIFMIIAWILCASCGIFTARYYKEDYSPCGVTFWFTIHRSCMALAAISTIASSIIIFVHAGGYTVGSRSAEKYHSILGIVVLSLMALQIAFAFFRPEPSSKRRPIFNWIHWTMGNGAHIIAIACIFLAKDLAKMHLQGMQGFWVTLTVFVFYHLVLHVTMSFVTLRADTRTDTVNSKRALTFGPLPSADRKDKVLLGSSEKGFNMTRTVLLLLYLGGAAVATTILISYVVNI